MLETSGFVVCYENNIIYVRLFPYFQTLYDVAALPFPILIMIPVVVSASLLLADVFSCYFLKSFCLATVPSRLHQHVFRIGTTLLTTLHKASLAANLHAAPDNRIHCEQITGSRAWCSKPYCAGEPCSVFLPALNRHSVNSVSKLTWHHDNATCWADTRQPFSSIQDPIRRSRLRLIVIWYGLITAARASSFYQPRDGMVYRDGHHCRLHILSTLKVVDLLQIHPARYRNQIATAFFSCIAWSVRR